MDYESAYKQALERAKSMMALPDDKAMIEEIFPELRESEDEMIRKELIDFLRFINKNGFVDDFSELNYTLWIAWLEKLKDVFAGFCDWNDYKDKPVDVWNAYIRGLNVGQERGKNAIKKCPEDYGLERKKPAWCWCDKDEDMVRLIGNAITTTEATTYLNEKGIMIIDAHVWLDSLKRRVQPKPKQEWSEEDYNEIETIACHLDNIGNEAMAESLLNIMDKYKSCRPQNTWKPSDEQMDNLSRAFNGASYINSLLMELYMDLKKLREE